jgi:hypothetical protein
MMDVKDPRREVQCLSSGVRINKFHFPYGLVTVPQQGRYNNTNLYKLPSVVGLRFFLSLVSRLGGMDSRSFLISPAPHAMIPYLHQTSPLNRERTSISRRQELSNF